jgi:hypothetical protein
VLRTLPICVSVYVHATALEVPVDAPDSGPHRCRVSLGAGRALAQEWTEFASREDRFTCNFPGQPAVTQTTWTSETFASIYMHENTLYIMEGTVPDG